MSKFFIGNVFLCVSLLSSAIGQVALKSLMLELDGNQRLMDKLQLVMAASRLWKVGVFGAGVGIGFLAWTVCLSKLDLSYAYTMACSSALLVTALSVALLGETAPPKFWLGTAFVIIGTVLLVPSK